MNHDSLLAYIIITATVSLLIGIGIGLYVCGTTSHASDEDYFRGRMEQEMLDSYGSRNPYKPMVPQYNDRRYNNEFKRPC